MKKTDDEIEREEWLAIRKAAGRKIDPETAEIDCKHGQIWDPYALYPELAEEFPEVGWIFFARSPGSDIWVEFGDLPVATRGALWEKLAFPSCFLDFVWRATDSNSE